MAQHSSSAPQDDVVMQDGFLEDEALGEEPPQTQDAVGPKALKCDLCGQSAEAIWGVVTFSPPPRPSSPSFSVLIFCCAQGLSATQHLYAFLSGVFSCCY